VHSVFFGWKRAHWAAVNYFRADLARLAVTPNRFDVLSYLQHRRDPPTQSELRHTFGVARATMSETLRALVRCGFVNRVRAHSDTRTFTITLTDLGRAVIERARCGMRKLVKRALAKIFTRRFSEDLVIMQMHNDIDHHIVARRALGDRAVHELIRLWHPD
jgi:DNA-binding MarR family transcriptional regulator